MGTIKPHLRLRQGVWCASTGAAYATGPTPLAAYTNCMEKHRRLCGDSDFVLMVEKKV